MRFTETEIAGAYLVDLDCMEDTRGFFGRSWCSREFTEHGLSGSMAQCSISYNNRRGTLRGMHFLAAPCAETKLVRCTAGAMYDVVLDLRLGSRTFRSWISVELTSGNRRALYVPEGCAHGYVTLTDGCEVFYQMSEFYSKEADRGVRWNDPAFGIEWPISDPIISDKDAGYPDFDSDRDAR